MLMMAVCMLFAACGESDKVKITFDTDGGAAIQSVELDIGEEYTLPTPERTGYVFEGWYDNAERTGAAVTKVKAEKDITFYAKWEQLCAITLQLGGGSLSAGTTFYVEEGTNVYTFMQSYVPTLADHEFGEWLVGGTPLSGSQTATKEGITLTAHYKVAYTVESYLQKLSLDGYEKAETDFVGYEYAGVELTPALEQKGFTLSTQEHSDAVTKKVLSENASENVFRLYYDREQYSLTLDANYPVGAPEDLPRNEMMTVYGGAEIEIPADLFTYEGYLLIGWSTSVGGEVKYRSAYIDSLLYNGTYGADTVSVNEDTILYAVWVQGYSDLFGGEDYIFHFSDTAEEIYLLRGGVLFEGVYNTRTEVFIFKKAGDSGDDLLAQGKLNADRTFSYFSDTRDGFSYIYFKNGVGADDNYTIYLDGYNGIRYVDKTISGLDNESTGSYTIDENNFYHVTYTTGPLAGRNFVYALSISSKNGAIFMVRDEEEFGWGLISRWGVFDDEKGGGVYPYKPEYYSLTLNGFGNAIFANGDGTSTTYFYVREDNVLKILSPFGQLVFEARLTKMGDTLGYFLYSAQYDVTYEGESGETLKLDGMYKATYTDANGASVEGAYALYSSRMGALVRFFGATETEQRLFLVRTETEKVDGDDGNPITINHYYFSEKPLGYNEYTYLQDGGIYSTILIVLEDGEEGKASVYCMQNKSYVKVLSGSFVYDEAKNLGSFSTETVYDFTPGSEPIPLASIKAFVFSTGVVQSTKGEVFYVVCMHSMTTEEGTDNYEVMYRAADGATLTLYRGFATYQMADGTIATGGCSVSEDGSFASLIDLLNGQQYLFELNQAEHTFLFLDDLFGTLNIMLEDGYIGRYETLTFNGKGGVTYSYPVVDENGQPVLDENGKITIKSYEGTYTRTEETTPFGYYIFEFKSEEVSFKFIIASISSSSTYFAKYNEAVHGEYNAETGTLQLDGFSFLGVYRDYLSGDEYSGIYSIPQENVIQLITGDGVFYFDLKGDTFTVRDRTFGNYLIINNQSISDEALSFDGYGNLTVYTLDENGAKVVLGEGKYQKEEDGSYVVNYKVGADDVTLVGWLGYIQSSSSALNAFFVSYDEVVSSYVIEEDWSVLVLDNRGNARRYDKVGEAEQGSYVIITENLLYYVNEKGDKACIYVYDKVNGTARSINYTERAYYTEDFRALLFSRYGFMIMGGETRYYYYVGSDGNVLLYRQNPSDPSANKYGFVEETFFGRFEEEKVIDGTTYYESSSFQLTFTRKADSKDLYPVPVTSQEDKHPLEQLKFSPTGANQFADSKAEVRIGGKEYSCTVVRVSDTEMYIKIASFRFDIKVTYRGDYSDEVNEYEITAMRTETQMYSYTYLNALLNFLMQGGNYIPENTFGMITLGSIFDEKGDEVRTYANGEFGPHSKLFDSKGNLVSFNDIGFTYENRIFTVEFKAEDGYTYRMHFAQETSFQQYLGMTAYGLHAFTRVEEFEADGYSICAERVIMTENPRVSIGGYWTIEVKKGEEVLNFNASYLVNGTIYGFVRTIDEATERITATKLYTIEFKQRTPVDAEDVVGELDPFVSATVTERELSVAYSEDGKFFAEYDADGIVLLSVGARSALVKTSEYNAETGTYTVTMYSGEMYTVSITDGVLTATQIEVEKE